MSATALTAVSAFAGSALGAAGYRLLRARRQAQAEDALADREAELRRFGEVLSRQRDALERLAFGDAPGVVLGGLIRAIERAEPGLEFAVLRLRSAAHPIEVLAAGGESALVDALDGAVCDHLPGILHALDRNETQTVSWPAAQSRLDPGAGRSDRLWGWIHPVRGLWSGDTVVLVLQGAPVPKRPAEYCARLLESARFALQHDDHAHYDPLTRLPNRTLLRRLVDEVALAATPEQRGGLLWIDLDGFTTVQQSLGPSVGDEVLCSVAYRLQRAAPDARLVARTEGDEFAVLVDRSNPERLADIGRDVQATLARPMRLSVGDTYYPSASIGISVSPDDAQDGAELMANSASAMSDARRAGGGCVRFFAPEINHEAYQRLRRSAQLREGLEREQLYLDYQPQFGLISGRAIGVEALVRWNHPDEGRISPGEFIPLAEQLGLIDRVGKWVLHHACRQGAAWWAEGLPVRMSVNLAPEQLLNQGFVDDLRQELGRSGLRPEALELEITEGSLVEDPDRAARNLDAVARLGVRIAVDDFGTGYSSLAYLRDFPIHCLKLDRSFVHGTPDDRSNCTIARTVAAMSHSLGLEMVAEGVETAAQWDFLARHGCDLGQGFWACRPLPAEKVARMLHYGLDRSDGGPGQRGVTEPGLALH